MQSDTIELREDRSRRNSLPGDSGRSGSNAEKISERLIYDEVRESSCGHIPFMFTVFAMLLWGGVLYAFVIYQCRDFDWFPAHLPFAAKWDAFTSKEKERNAFVAIAVLLILTIFSIFEIIAWVVATRIAVDKRGIKKLRRWGGDCFLVEWANVRSWWVESYKKSRFETVTRLVVKFKSKEKPFVLEEAPYQMALIAELSAFVPMRRLRCTDSGAADTKVKELSEVEPMRHISSTDSGAADTKVKELSEVESMRRSRDISAMDQPCRIPPDQLTYAGFRWVERPCGYRVDFPFPDRMPHQALGLWLSLGTFVPLIVGVILSATGHPLGELFTSVMFIPLVIGGPYSVAGLIDNAKRRSAFNRCIACLDIGPEFLTVEYRDGRKQEWRRTAIHSVIEKDLLIGDEGNYQYYTSVNLCFHDFSSFHVWGRETRDDFPFFREKFWHTTIRAEVGWLSSTLRQALELPATDKPIKFNG
jgi:hypothetical protein